MSTPTPRPSKNFQFSERGNGTSALISAGLGCLFGLGVGLTFMSVFYFDFGLYMIFFATFHLWEFNYVAFFRPAELTAHSFLLDWGPQYTIAVGFTIFEYFVEQWLFGPFKGVFLFVLIGFLVAAAGQSIRTLSMYTAGSNFNHVIEEDKRSDHHLVTFGIYQYLRHPSYFGWFWWSIAIQVILMNPIGLAGSAYVAWRFFEDRIEAEEKTLIEQFGSDYERYRSVTPVGIPFIK